MDNFSTFKRLARVVVSALILSVGAAAFAQPGPPPEKCLYLNRIKRTEIIDERNIIFYMRNKEIYRNQLPARCGGLKPRETIMYRPSISRLCSLDFITVLRSSGFGFIQGPSCGLGEFYPIDEFAVAKLKEQAEIQRQLRKKKKADD